MNEVTHEELDESFNIKISWPKTIAFVKTFSLTNGAGVTFSGRLYWDANDGYTIQWDNDKAPEMADRPEFEYVLDSHMLGNWGKSMPQYGDLSDAGMDGA